MAAILFYFFIVTVLSKSFEVNSLKLKQVLILSRHNVRAPLMKHIDGVTPYKWPAWTEEKAYLTSKGVLLEEYMGEYFSTWLENRKLLPDGCPNDRYVFIYANSKQRTIATAEAFVRTAFKNCNIHVHHKNIDEVDLVFHPVIHNSSETFKNDVYKQINIKLKQSNISDAFMELDRILDTKDSNMCKDVNFCSFVDAKNTIVFRVNEEPDFDGPLNYGNNVVDLFLMSYYNGMPLDEIAWGKIKNLEQFELLTKITKENQDLRFNVSNLSEDIARPLLHFISDSFLNRNIPFTLLVGHDSNLNSLMRTIEFKNYVLPNQHEKTPPGGKLVFQKWFDEVNNVYLLKIEFVYQTTKQLRDGTRLSMDDPPARVVLELKDCHVNDEGFCLWDDFVKILEIYE